MGYSLLAKGVDVGCISEVAGSVSSSQFLEDEGGRGDVEDMIVVVRPHNHLHRLPKVEAIIVLGCQVNVGNDDGGDDGFGDGDDER